MTTPKTGLTEKQVREIVQDEIQKLLPKEFAREQRVRQDKGQV